MTLIMTMMTKPQPITCVAQPSSHASSIVAADFQKLPRRIALSHESDTNRPTIHSTPPPFHIPHLPLLGKSAALKSF